MNTSFLSLGWRTLWRDLRSGELRLVMVAVTLAVAALTAVGFFSDRLQGGLQRDARQLLGGDAVIVSDNAPAPQWEKSTSLVSGYILSQSPLKAARPVRRESRHIRIVECRSPSHAA